MPRPGATKFLDDFSGGLNYRDPPMSLAGNETQDALNVTSLGRTMQKRFGALTAGTLASAGTYIFASDLGYRIVQRGTALYAYQADYTAPSTIIAAVGSQKVACVDFAGVVVIHTAAGVYTWPGGGSATLRLSEALPVGSIAVWQNKVWVTDGNRLLWCAAGDPTTWNTTEDFVFIREPDDAAIISVGVGSGTDQLGRDGLLVIKKHSGHKVIDSETGEYVTLWSQPGLGVSGHESVCTVDGVVYFQNSLGMFRLVGDLPQRIDERIAPAGMYGGLAEGGCAFACGGRVYFSRENASTIWEYVPETGAWWRHSLYTGSVYRYAISATRATIASNIDAVELLDNAGLSVVTWRPVVTNVSIGSDYAALTLPCSYAAPWLSFGLERAQVWRAVLEGWGSNVALSLKSDYQGALTSYDADLDFAVPADKVFSGRLERFQLGVHRAVSLYFAETSATASIQLQKSTLDPVNQYAPGFGLNAIRLDTIGLGRG